MSAAAQHPNIELLTYSEIQNISGDIGNFQVTIRKKAKDQNHDLCTGCGLCETKCPSKAPNAFDKNMAKRPAIYKPFAQAVPNKPVIDAAHCRMLQTGKCGVCAKVCPLGCINFEDQDQLVTETFGAIVLATGYELINGATIMGNMAVGVMQMSLTACSLSVCLMQQARRKGKSSAPPMVKHRKPLLFKNVLAHGILNKGHSYCSRACCMYSAKHDQYQYWKKFL